MVKRKLRFCSIPVTERLDNCVEKAVQRACTKTACVIWLTNPAFPKKLQEENRLIEAGFKFVRCSEKEQVAIYRKRK